MSRFADRGRPIHRGTTRFGQGGRTPCRKKGNPAPLLARRVRAPRRRLRRSVSRASTRHSSNASKGVPERVHVCNGWKADVLIKSWPPSEAREPCRGGVGHPSGALGRVESDRSAALRSWQIAHRPRKRRRRRRIASPCGHDDPLGRPANFGCRALRLGQPRTGAIAMNFIIGPLEMRVPGARRAVTGLAYRDDSYRIDRARARPHQVRRFVPYNPLFRARISMLSPCKSKHRPSPW